MRLNTLEFAGMLGVLGGLTLVGLLPASLAWNLSLAAASLAGCSWPSCWRPAFAAGSPSAPAAATRRRAAASAGAAGRAAADRAAHVRARRGHGARLVRGEPVRDPAPRDAGVRRSIAQASRACSRSAQLVDLIVLLPVGWLADRIGRLPVLTRGRGALGLGLFAVGLGSLPLLVVGCALFGLGMAGWMLPLGVIREHTDVARLGWRTGVYRVGVDGAIFLGPFVSGLLGEAGAGAFVAAVGVLALIVGGHLLWPNVR